TGTGYVIERMSNTSSWTTVDSLSGNIGTGTMTYSNTGLTEGTVYYYRVRATLGIYKSTSSNIVSVITLPNAPDGLSVTFASGAQANFGWHDNSSGEVGYIIEQLLPDGITWQQVTSVSSGTGTMSASINGEYAPLTSYTFRVRAYEQGLGD